MIPKKLHDEQEGQFLSWNQLQEMGWTLKDLLTDLLCLDRQLLPGMPDDLIGDVDLWLPVYESMPETWRVLLGINDEVLAYWHFTPINESNHVAFLSGKLTETQLTPDMAIDPATQRPIYLWLDSFFFNYARMPGQFVLLMGSVLSVIHYWARQGIFFTAISMHAVSAPAKAFCIRAGMKDFGKHPCGIGHLYSLTLLPPPTGKWAQRTQELFKLYANHANCLA